LLFGVVDATAPGQLSKEIFMKAIIFIAIFASAVAPASLLAEGQTRAQVYQELIDAQQNGLNYVTDTSYPEVHPSFTTQVARRKQQTPARGADNNQPY
jgi:hypothetical protein